MADVFICQTGSLTARSLRDLRKAGVVVAEADDPSHCQFVRAGEVVSGDDMLWAALSAMQQPDGKMGGDGSHTRERFAARLFELVNAAHTKQAFQTDPVERT